MITAVPRLLNVQPSVPRNSIRLVPRYFQWVAVAPKIGKRLGGFLSQPGLILGVDSNCSGGREKRPSCVKKLRKPHKTQVFRGLRIESLETSQLRWDRRFHLPNFWSCRSSRHWELPVAGSHWPSGTTDLDGQLTENSEEPSDFGQKLENLLNFLSALTPKNS